MKKILLSALALGLATLTNAQSWTQQISGTTNYLQSVHFVNATTGWAVGNANTILKTTNGGATWLAQTSPLVSTSNLTDVYFINSNEGAITVENNKILYTTDGGTNWLQASIPTTTANILLTDVRLENFVGFACGSGAVYKTLDNGANWAAVTNTVLSAFSNYNLNDVHIIGTNTIVLMSTFYTHVSTDGGTTWNATAYVSPGNNGLAMEMFNLNTAIIVGANSSCYKTTTGVSGFSNTPVPLITTTQSFYGIDFYDNSNGWIVGSYSNSSGGLIFKTTNAGTTWSNELVLPGINFLGCSAIDANNAWVVGQDGTIYKYGLNTFVNEQVKDNAYSIYPNPATNNITINSSTTLHKIMVTDVLGKIVLTQTSANTSESIDLSHLQTGVYFLTANGATKKIIKE
jgi:photosystem II stability/assembly factor-like uncharacterized protein